MTLFTDDDPRSYDDSDRSAAAAIWRLKRDAGSLENSIEDFPVGTPVRVVTQMQDFAFFRGDELGVVTEHTGIRHLPLIVRFLDPIRYQDGLVRTEHNFALDDVVVSDDPRAAGFAAGYLAGNAAARGDRR